MTTNPTLPTYVVCIDGEPYELTQDRVRAREYGEAHAEGMARRERMALDQARARITIETLSPEWPAAETCARTDVHEPHNWLPDTKWRCAGIVRTAAHCASCGHAHHIGPCDQMAPWTFASSPTGKLLLCGCVIA